MNFETLQQIKKEQLSKIALRFNKPCNLYEKEICICFDTGCQSTNSAKLFEEFANQLKINNLTSKIALSKVGCFGFCSLGSIVVIYPQGYFYTKVKAEDAAEIVQQSIINDSLVERLLYTKEDLTKAKIQTEIDFYKKQKHIARKNSQFIDAENIKDYIALDGYMALYKALTTYQPKDIVDIIKTSGLRGRGGAGFSTGTKWEFAYNNESDEKFVICNADEGDPGAFMDRSILEGDPHSVLEAMAIEGYAIGAKKGFIYVRAEYPLATKRLEIAINQAKENNLLGDNIFGTDFCFDIELRLGAGAFVCGEETALINSVEGKRGEPRLRPPYPAEKGVYGKPTVVNNVETLAIVAQIILNGAEWFLRYGTKNSPGTKVFALTGKIKNTGLIETEMGTTLRELIYDLGGGIPDGKKLKAIQMGGPSGGCLTANDLDIKIDYESLKEHNAMMGSGGVIVMDEDTCMVDIAKFFIEFSCDESCGKCTPCRIGNKRILEILNKITGGKATMGDLDTLKELCIFVKENSLCGLGQSSPNPILSSLNNFYDEYIEHIVNKRCPAKVCKDLVTYVIKENCVGCSACFRVCPVDAISKAENNKYVIDQQKCIRCGKCFATCRFNAIARQ